MLKPQKESVVKIITVVLSVLTILAFLKGIWVSLDMDESYAAALGYRLARGDRLLKDMWEPHQFSGLLAALFTVPYVWIRGNTDYLIIYLRIIGVLIHAALGLALYLQLKKSMSRFSAFCIMVMHLNFLPKWVQMPEFELVHYWCLLGIFLVLYSYFSGSNLGSASKHPYSRLLLPFAGGCFLVCSMLCYPTMILLYPFYVLALCVLERQYDSAKGIRILRSSIAFTLGALSSGSAFLACLFSYMSFDDLKRYISYIFMDTSHGVYTMEEKWALYFEQFQGQLGDYGFYLLSALGIALAVFLFGKMIFGRGTPRFAGSDILHMAVTVLLMAGLLMQITAVYGFLFEDKNQFYFQVRYLAILLPALLLGIYSHRRMAVWLYLCVIPGIVSVPAVLFVTNMDTNTAYTKAFFGVLGSFIIFNQSWAQMREGTVWKKIFPIVRYAAGGMMLAGLLVCRLVLIRVSGCLPVTIRAPLEKMESGPEKGIYVLADTAKIWNDNYRELDKHIQNDDKVLYIGAESLSYVYMEALLATPSTQGTVVYNEIFPIYYEEHPDRIPNVIVYDKTFGENPVYALSYAFTLQNPVLFHWIEENYREAQKIETEHLIILRQQ
ncbi:MAG: hypothetical protein K2G28_04395 [Acetatifactor sp.]|nr:hypothetical protein [Acetatifactor sp.]MDE7353598.1 hypothetical protein [Acetatifactor sp.]